MRILVLAPQPFFQNRGTPIAVRMLVEDLQRGGHQVELLVFHEGEEVDLGGVVIHRTAAIPGIHAIGPGFSLKKIACDGAMLFKAVRLCRQKHYDMVHAVEEAVFMAMLIKLFYRIPYIYDIDSWLSDQLIDKYTFLQPCRSFFSIFEKLAVRHSSGAVAVCQALEEKVRIIDAAKPLLRLEDVSLLQDDIICSESLKDCIGNQGELILYVGNLEVYQGIDLLVAAFAILSGRHSTSNLVIIGGSDRDREKYQGLAEELAIGARVFFIGPRPIEHLGKYLQQADLLVSPRVKGENTPMKIYSYMASGVPIVATRIRSHTQVLDEHISFLADPISENLADSLLKGLEEKDNALARAALAQEKVEREFSRSAFEKKLTGFYSELAHVRNLRF